MIACNNMCLILDYAWIMMTHSFWVHWVIIISWSTLSTQEEYLLENKAHVRVKRQSDDYKVVCYILGSNGEGTDMGDYTIQDIDPHICTHVIYAYVRVIDNDLDIDLNLQGIYSDLRELKHQNPSLKVLISIGGSEMTSSLISVSETSVLRSAFSRNVVKYLHTHVLDGLDVDWRTVEKNQRGPLLSLLQELSSQFAGTESEIKIRLLLSCTLSTISHVIDNSYDLPNMINYIDFANLLTYDFVDAWPGVTTFHSPLYGFNSTDRLNQDWVVQKYLSEGVPPHKLVVGIPTYSKTYTLCSFMNSDVGSCAMTQGLPGWITKSPGILAYYEVCVHLSNGWTEAYSEEYHANYIYHYNQWIGLENMESITEKAEYVRENSLGGVMFWKLSLDDFQGSCGDGNYPLINAARKVLMQTDTTTPITTTDELSSTTKTISETDSTVIEFSMKITKAQEWKFSCSEKLGCIHHLWIIVYTISQLLIYSAANKL